MRSFSRRDIFLLGMVYSVYPYLNTTNNSFTLFTDDVRDELGMARRPEDQDEAEFAHMWQYESLKNPPPRRTGANMVATIYRGLVPAATIAQRDIAINGAVVSTAICAFTFFLF
jgi:hypothetical protein